MTIAEIRALIRSYWSGDLTLEMNIVRIINVAMNPDCCPIKQQATQDQVDAWYQADGRDDPDHSMHCLYTGLAKKYRQPEAQ